jgi:enamine deaminase RidA (YjgF/YER057c/UK114 family)
MRMPRGRPGAGWRFTALLAVACAVTLLASPPQRRKQKREEETQTLQLPRELPAAVAADTRRLAFHVTPLSGRGLLSAQVREALRALQHEAAGPIVHIRAFVSGTGDARRVRDLVSEVFTERKQPLPALSLVQAGGLPLEGAQVVLEAASVAKKEVNPHGLAFFSAEPAVSGNPLDPAAPLAEKSLAQLGEALRDAGVEASDVLRVTCYLSSLDNLLPTRKLVASAYPHAAADYIQTQRVPLEAVGACEAVARLHAGPGAPLRLLDFNGLPRLRAGSHAALAEAGQLVLTGTQASFGYREQDGRLAFDRMRKVLEQAGAAPDGVMMVHYYPLAPALGAQVEKLKAEFFGGAHPPAASLLLFEGLPSMDAGFAMDVVAVKR